jgi:hypothetical protein
MGMVCTLGHVCLDTFTLTDEFFPTVCMTSYFFTTEGKLQQGLADTSSLFNVLWPIIINSSKSKCRKITYRVFT